MRPKRSACAADTAVNAVANADTTTAIDESKEMTITIKRNFA